MNDSPCNRTRVPAAATFPTFRRWQQILGATCSARLERSFLPTAFRKELRALLPLWLAALILPGLLLALTHSFLAPGALLILCAMLGGEVLGGEYSARTLAQLLAQPAARTLLWRRKMGALLAALVSTLLAWGLALYGFSQSDGTQLGFSDTEALITTVWAFAGTYCSAPWLSMICRSGLAGWVFSLAIPLMWAGVVSLAALIRYGSGADAALASAEWRLAQGGGVLLFWAFAAVRGRRTFLRLECNDARERQLSLPRWITRWFTVETGARVPAGSGWLLPLIGKELHLQQVPLMLGGVFAFVWAAAAAVKHFQPEARLEMLGPISLIYCAVVGLLAGSVCIAEERQLGTFDGQATLPVSSNAQWTVKVVTALTLAATLGIGLTLGLARTLTTTPDDLGEAFQVVSLFAFFGCMAAIVTSTFASCGLRAFLGAVLLAVGALIAFGVGMLIVQAFGGPMTRFLGGMGTSTVLSDREVHRKATIWLFTAVFACTAWRALSVSRRNYSQGPRCNARLAWPLIQMSLLLLAGTVFAGVFSRMDFAPPEQPTTVLMERTN